MEPFHDIGKALVRHLEGRTPQAPELADHRARHEQRNPDRHGQDQRDADTSEPGVTGRTRNDRVAPVLQVGRELVLHVTQPGEPVVGGRQPRLRVDADRLAHLSREHSAVAHLRDVVGGRADRLVEEVLLLLGRGGAELGDPGVLGTGVGLDQFDDSDIRLVEKKDHSDKAALEGCGFLRAGHAAQAGSDAGQFRVVRPGADLGDDVQEVGHRFSVKIKIFVTVCLLLVDRPPVSGELVQLALGGIQRGTQTPARVRGKAGRVAPVSLDGRVGWRPGPAYVVAADVETTSDVSTYRVAFGLERINKIIDFD